MRLSSFLKKAIFICRNGYYGALRYGKRKVKAYDEIRLNHLGWDVTDFGKGRFLEEGLTLVTIRNGNIHRDKKVTVKKS